MGPKSDYQCLIMEEQRESSNRQGEKTRRGEGDVKTDGTGVTTSQGVTRKVHGHWELGERDGRGSVERDSEGSVALLILCFQTSASRQWQNKFLLF